jgi:biotin transport system substrate-specific component
VFKKPVSVLPCQDKREPEKGLHFMDRKQLQLVVYASLMAALICVGAYLTVPIPIGPVPLVLQNLFVLLAGLLLGSRWGLTSVGIYLLVGAIGLPVFVGGKGGLAHFLGPTGGYLFGFAAAAFVTGYLAERFRSYALGDIVAVVAGVLMVFLLGVPWLKTVTGMAWEKAFLVGMAPFLPGDVLKATAAVLLARAIRPMVRHQIEFVGS